MNAIVLCAWLAASFAGLPGETSFEAAPAGELRERVDAAARWSAEPGHARIDDAHARTGEQCLHLLGGEARRVELVPQTGGAPASELRFWAERWTAREPFTFRIEALRSGAWSEIYAGDEAIAIGGFRTEVVVPLGDEVERLRFTCTSPSGVLVDDLRIGRAAPMEVTSVETAQPIAPLLVGRSGNPVAELRIEADGSLEPVVVTAVSVKLTGTLARRHLVAAELVDTNGRPLGEALPIAAAASRRAPTSPEDSARSTDADTRLPMRLEFRGALPLVDGLNALQLRVELTPDADLDAWLDAAFLGLELGDGSKRAPSTPNPAGVQRLGLALRDAGDDGSAAYRIPAITTSNGGTLIAVYDIRWKGWGDLPGDIDVGMSRSTDGGRTWEPMRTILDLGDDAEHAYDGVGDPAILYDKESGTIWVASTWSHGQRAWRGSGPGLTPDETGQLVLTHSTDDGRTWSSPRNITAEVKRPEWCYLLQGPGRGICTSDGTLVFAAQYQDTPANGRVPRSTILYSIDRGATWRLGAGIRADTTEAQVVELEPGVLMLNARDNLGKARSIFTTRDLGATWSEHPTSRSALVEPVCNAALLKTGERTLVFCNPAVPLPPRRHMTLKLSTDLGASWPAENALRLDAGRSAGYPSLTSIDRETIGVLYESSRAQLVFQRVPLAAIAPARTGR